MELREVEETALSTQDVKINNGIKKATTKKLKIDLPCFWPPSAPSVSSSNTSPG